jgi:hypothetical protein
LELAIDSVEFDAGIGVERLEDDLARRSAFKLGKVTARAEFYQVDCETVANDLLGVDVDEPVLVELVKRVIDDVLRDRDLHIIG